MRKLMILLIVMILASGAMADLTGTEGLAIDLSSAGAGTDFTIAFDATELDAVTWSDAANASNLWTFSVSGTNPTLLFGNALVTLTGGLTTSLDLIVTGGDITLGTTSIFSGGDVASLNNIDAINATTETTLEAAIDALTNLVTVGTIGTGVWEGTAIADGYIPNDITIDLATLATTVTLGDDDATNDNQDIVFTTDAAGAVNLEADIGDFYYNPSTGTVTATEYVGGGAGLTAIDAATGDSATAFFDAGTIEHEWGGLQADISGYTGLIAITGVDTTAEIDSLDELEGQLADVTRIVTEAIMPVAAADPDVDASGELAVDTDGANEPNDVVLRTASVSGSQQYALAQVIKSIQGTVITPNDLADATRDACPVWENNTGMSFVITMIRAWSDTDDTTLNVETYDSAWANNATVDALEIASNGTANFYVEETTITAGTIAAGSLIVLDFDDTDDPGWVKFNIMGYFLADVD